MLLEGLGASKFCPLSPTASLGIHATPSAAFTQLHEVLMNRETAVAHFQQLGAGCGVRRRADVGEVIGIQLRNSRVTDIDLAMLEYLADDVDVIGLENTKITDGGLTHLTCLSKLENIDLAHTAISDAGLEILSSIKTLENLYIEGTKVTEEGVKRFEREVPGCEVSWDAALS